MKQAGRKKKDRKRSEGHRSDERADLHSSLAGRDARIVPTRATLPLSVGLKALKRRFDGLYDRIFACARSGQAGTRPEEWLLDNRHVIEQTLEDIRKDLPVAYLKQLPLVAADDEQGGETIRVKDLADPLMRTENQPIEVASLERAVERYQTVTRSRGPPTRTARRSIAWNRTSCRGTSMASRRTPAAAAGAGTAVRRPGCIEPASRRCSAYGSAAMK